jgi:hypothetical protein
MVSGEYCTFSAFSTMVSRLALDHLDHYLNIIMIICIRARMCTLSSTTSSRSFYSTSTNSRPIFAVKRNTSSYICCDQLVTLVTIGMKFR